MIGKFVHYGWFAGAVIVLFLVVRWWPNDLRAVDNATDKLLETVSKHGPENLPQAAARSFSTGSYLSSNVVLELGTPFPSVLRRQEAISLVQQGRMRVDRLVVERRGSESIQLEDGTIKMDITLYADITYRNQSDVMLGVYRLFWGKEEGDWKILRGEILEVIEHPVEGAALW